MAIGINLKNIPLIYQSLDGGLSWDAFLPELPDSIGQGYYPTDIEISIAIMPYQNIHPISHSEVDNYCRFNNCRFNVTEDTLVELDFNSHMWFIGIVGVKISGCNFNNNRPINYDEMDDRGIGINALSSSFYVSNYCLNPQITPCDTFQPSHFENLTYGIKSIGVGPGKTCTIEYSEFDENLTGIYLSNLDLPTVILNDFEVISTNSNGIEMYACGLYLDDCDGYQIEDNIFNSGYNIFSSTTSIGIVVNNSGTNNNEIYNNSFANITQGVLAQNVNRDEKGSSGLQIRCNDFSICEYDIAVTSEMGGDSIGIRYEQGSNDADPTAPANNLFSYTWNNDESDYYNGCQDILYYYLADTITANTKPKKYSDPEVNPTANSSWLFQWDEDENCPSNLTSGGGGIEEERSSANEALVKSDSIQNLLNILVDGGNTSSLVSDVQTSFPDEASELHGELMGESPYLSDTVMMSAIQKENVLNPALVTDILTANPQSAKSAEVQDALDGRSELLSEEQRTDIDQGWFVVGAKESLESSLSFQQSKRSKALNNVLRILRSDTINIYRTDSVLAQLAIESNIERHYEYAFELLNKKEYSGAAAYLNNIPNTFNLSAKQTAQHQQYVALLNLLTQKASQGLSIMEMNTTDIASLHTIYGNSMGRLKSGVRNLLSCFDTTICYNEPYILPSENFKSGKVRRVPVLKIYEANSLRLYPNPARNYVIAEYTCKDDHNKGLLEIRNNIGKDFMTVPFNSNHDYLVISTDKLPSGIYFCNLVLEGNIITTEKLIITK